MPTGTLVTETSVTNLNEREPGIADKPGLTPSPDRGTFTDRKRADRVAKEIEPAAPPGTAGGKGTRPGAPGRCPVSVTRPTLNRSAGAPEPAETPVTVTLLAAVRLTSFAGCEPTGAWPKPAGAARPSGAPLVRPNPSTWPSLVPT